MVITKEQIEARRDKLQASIQKHQADIGALAGALQDCNYWLSVLEVEQQTQDQNQPKEV